MSTTKVAPSRAAGASLDYAFYGDSGEQKQAHLEAGTSRVAAFRSSMGDEPTEALRAALQQDAEDHGRKNELYVYTLSFHPDEFDVTRPEDLQRVADVGEKLAQRMHSADYAVVVHADAAGGHAHAHIYVNNHDNITGKSLQKYTSWTRGLHQLNDELMREENLRQLPDPMREKLDWTLRREEFTAGGFEQVLGDKIAAGLRDPRSTDREAFEAVLAEHGVRLRVTARDGWTYSMRREDNGKWGRKKASGLTPEFTDTGAREIFEYHQQRQERTNEYLGRDEATGQLGTVASVDVAAGRVREPDHRTDQGVDGRRKRSDRAAERDREEHRGPGQSEAARVADPEPAERRQPSAAQRAEHTQRHAAEEARRTPTEGHGPGTERRGGSGSVAEHGRVHAASAGPAAAAPAVGAGSPKPADTPRQAAARAAIAKSQRTMREAALKAAERQKQRRGRSQGMSR